MSKKVVVVSSSFRKNGNSETLANEFIRGAKEAIKDIEGWVECFEGVTLKGVVKGTGANDVGDILSHKDKLEEAYNLGKNI